MSQLRAGVVAAVLLASSASAAIGANQRTPGPASSISAARSQGLRERLDAIAAQHAAGELDAARELLASLFADELVREELRSLDLESARATWSDLDVLAGQLGLVRLRVAAREGLLAALVASSDEDDLDVLAAALELASARLENGELRAAIELMESVGADYERLLEPEDPRIFRTKQNLANAVKQAGDLARALELEEEVFAFRRRTLPLDDLELLTIQLNLGGTRYYLGDLAGANELFEHVHASLERLLPPRHEYLLLAKQALAVGDLGDHDRALALKEYVHDVRAETLPEGHPGLLIAKSNLAITLEALGRDGRARDLREAVYAAAGGRSCPRITTSSCAPSRTWRSRAVTSAITWGRASCTRRSTRPTGAPCPRPTRSWCAPSWPWGPPAGGSETSRDASSSTPRSSRRGGRSCPRRIRTS